jgi:hypothetical protein
VPAPNYQDQPIDLAPGIFSETSENASTGRYISGTNLRFWKNFPERIGGWSTLIDTRPAQKVRGAIAWRALPGTQYIAYGTANQLLISTAGTVTAITPGGAGDFTAGSEDSVAQTGYGVGAWGSGYWGGTAPTLYANVTPALVWTMATWGEDLLACPRGGKILWLDTSAFLASSTVNAEPISDTDIPGSTAPLSALGIFVADVNRTLVAYGAAGDPLNVAWSDSEDFTDFTPTATNTAGSIRCETGTTIVGHIPTKGGHLIITDRAVYSFRYIGGTFVFSLTKAAEGPSMISQLAGTEFNGVSFWMGNDTFYAYGGTVETVPCDVQSYVFGDINLAQKAKICCGTIRKFNEIIWFYPSSTSSENDRCVAFNVVDQTWWTGDLARTTWLDVNAITDYPVGFSSDRYIYIHEYGTDGMTATTVTDINYTLETSDIEIGDGSFLHARKLLPDFDRITGNHSVSIEVRGYPSRSAETRGPYALTSATDNISVRARGRHMRFLFSGSGDVRFGRWRARLTQHGGRP